MTRKSKREVERALENLGGDVAPSGSGPSLTESQKEAIRAVLRYRRKAHPSGDGPPSARGGGLSKPVVEEAIGEIDDRHVRELEPLFDWLEVTP